MPCYLKSNGKWGIGSGKGIYKTKAICEKALKGYYSSKSNKNKKSKRRQ